MTPMSDITIFDTDMLIHSLGHDSNVREKAKKLLNKNLPTAICSFSILELKSNYIQRLILIKRKIHDSDTFQDALARILNSGGRTTQMMFAQLIYLAGLDNNHTIDLRQFKNRLTTEIDAHIDFSWHYFTHIATFYIDKIQCTRASEPPEENEGHWSASIPKCNTKNKNCLINKFILDNINLAKSTIDYIDKMSSPDATAELKRIRDILKITVQKNRFPWDKNSCRKIGDFIIALQCVGAKKLISSNFKEHSHLSNALKYNFEHFDVSNIRMK